MFSDAALVLDAAAVNFPGNVNGFAIASVVD
jgi:hypothetical protein